MDANSGADDHHHHRDRDPDDESTPGNKNNAADSSYSSAAAAAAANGKPKRQMKTPFQLETLEKAYSLETYPSEATRTKLSQELGLSDRQLQMWFCHRRLKDRKEDKRDGNGMKKPHGKASSTLMKSSSSPVDDYHQFKAGSDDHHHQVGSDDDSECGSGSSRYVEPSRNNVACFDDGHVPRRYYQSSLMLSAMEARAIACVEAQLEEPLREDGPVLGIKFDPLPPDAFGAAIALTEQERYSNRNFRRRKGKLRKAPTKLLHEHHDQSIVQSHAYGQVIQSPYHDHPLADTTTRGRASKFVNGDQHFTGMHAVKPTRSRVPLSSPQSRTTGHQNLLSPQSITGHLLSSPDNDDDDVDDDDDLDGEENEFLQPPAEPPFINNTKRSEESTSSHMFRDSKVFHDGHDPDIRPAKKRKNDEPRLLRNDENQVPRRKNEEHKRKKEALQRRDQDRESRKENDRYVHERRQLDEERTFQKEYLMA